MRLRREIPVLLHADEPQLPASVLTSVPWRVDADRAEVGEWATFRRHAWWALWVENYHRIQRGDRPVSVVLIETLRLREINFQHDEEYPALSRLAQPSLLILIGGAEAPSLQGLIRDFVQQVLHLRRIRRRATWCFNVAAAAYGEPLTPSVPVALPAPRPLPPAAREAPRAVSPPPASAVNGDPTKTRVIRKPVL